MNEKVSLKKLLSFGSLIDSETYMQLLKFQLQGDKYVNVPSGTLSELQNRLAVRKQKELELNACSKLNNRGIEFEKTGKIKQAIRLYEINITNGYPAHHSYKRLMILYHKQKDFDNEIRVIKRALEVFCDYTEYLERLSKLDKRINKKEV